MTTSKYYKVTSAYMKGHAFASYKSEELLMLICEWSHQHQDARIMVQNFPITLTGLECSEVFTIKELVPRTVSEKCALFIMMFKEYRNVVYTPSKTERANLKLVTCNRQLLETYFKAKDYPLAGPKTITDYIRNYNAVRDLAANGRPVRTSFPDVYDRDYERTLGDNPAKLQLYWQHLRDLGWKKVDHTWTLNHLSTKAHED